MVIIEPTSDFEIALAIQGLLGEDLKIGDSHRKFGTYFTHENLVKIFSECNLRLCNYQVRL